MRRKRWRDCAYSCVTFHIASHNRLCDARVDDVVRAFSIPVLRSTSVHVRSFFHGSVRPGLPSVSTVGVAAQGHPMPYGHAENAHPDPVGRRGGGHTHTTGHADPSCVRSLAYVVYGSTRSRCQEHRRVRFVMRIISLHSFAAICSRRFSIPYIGTNTGVSCCCQSVWSVTAANPYGAVQASRVR